MGGTFIARHYRRRLGAQTFKLPLSTPIQVSMKRRTENDLSTGQKYCGGDFNSDGGICMVSNPKRPGRLYATLIIRGGRKNGCL